MSYREAFTIMPSFTVEGTEVVLCKSKATGMQVCLVKADGPMVNLYATVATEALTEPGVWHCDDGLPHTLEHLVFLGSQSYPYKGVLDKLANRCLAQGTNAWTDVDHTAYTVTTAGSEGFLNILPIYLDHILRPTMTEAGFITEVHHVNGQGEDKGVVYCEMQGRENSDSSLCERACLTALFPDDACGYKSETGGIMANLHDLTVEQVRRYHKEYYRPSNLFLIVTGSLDLDALLDTVGAYDASYAAATKQEPKVERERPFSAPVPPMPAPLPWAKTWTPPTASGSDDDEEKEEEKKDETKVGGSAAAQGNEVVEEQPVELQHVGVQEVSVEFPSEDESCGTVVLGWRTQSFGPELALQNAALGCLMSYLADSSSSPLMKAFVESETAFAADLFYGEETFREGYVQVWVEGVETSELDQVLPTFLHTMNQEVNGGFDSSRMAGVLARKGRQYRAKMEDSPADHLVTPLIKHFLYHDGQPQAAASTSKKGKAAAKEEQKDEEVTALAAATATRKHLEVLNTWTPSDWCKLIHSQFLQRPMVCVHGIPSSAKVSALETATQQRVAAIRASLGAAQLAAQASKVDAAQAENNRDIPESMLREVAVPSTSNIPFFNVCSFRVDSSKIPNVLVPLGTSTDGKEAQKLSDTFQKAVAPPAIDSSGGGPGPFDLQLDHIASDFLRLEVAFDTSGLTNQQRLFLSLIIEVAFKLPTRDPSDPLSIEIDHEATASALERDLVGWGNSAGFGGSGPFSPGPFGQFWRIYVKVEKGQLDLACSWLRKLLFGSRLDPSRLSVAVASLLASIPETKRSAGTMAGAAMAEMLLEQGSNRTSMTPVRQHAFLLSLQARLKAGPEAAAAVAAECEAARRALCHSNVMPSTTATKGGILKPRLRVAGNLNELAPNPDAASSLLAAVANMVPATAATNSSNTAPLVAADSDATSAWVCNLCTAEGKLPTGRGLVLGLASIENSCLLAVAPGLAWGHPDEAALAVAMEYLTALEGDFWVQLRGAGLTYGYSLYCSKEQGLVYFNLSRCSDPPKAMAAAAAIVNKYASGNTPFAITEFENAKSSLCSEQLGYWEDKSGALRDTFNAWFYLTNETSKAGGMPTAEAYRRGLMARMQAVTPEQALKALQTYVPPLFDPTKSCFAVAAPLSEHERIASALGKKGVMAGLLSKSDEECNKVITVKEKDLESMFPVLSGDDDDDEQEQERVWPLGKQPFWRTHRSLTLAAAAATAAVATAAALRLMRHRRA